MTLAALALTATVLTACGSSGGSGGSSGGSGGDSGASKTDTYCTELKADKKFFDSFGQGDVSQFDAALDKFHSLADKAPSEVSADWKLIDDAISKAQSDLKAAGVTFTDLAKAEKTGKAPKGADPAKLQKVVADFQAMTGTKFDKASKNIEKHAKSECKVDLSSTG